MGFEPLLGRTTLSCYTKFFYRLYSLNYLHPKHALCVHENLVYIYAWI